MSHNNNIDVGSTALASGGGSYFKKALGKEAPVNSELTAACYYPSSLSQEYDTAKKVAEIGGPPSEYYYQDEAAAAQEEDQRNEDDVADENDEGAGRHSYGGG